MPSTRTPCTRRFCLRGSSSTRPIGVAPSACDFSISFTITCAASPAPATITSLPRATIPFVEGRSRIVRASMREPATNASSSSQSMIAIERGSRICSTGRGEVDDEAGDEAGDRHAAHGGPHVARRDVAPPAVVEAEEDEDRELHDDDDRERAPEQRLVVRRDPRRVEAQAEGEVPRGDDQAGVGGKLPEAVPVDHEATPTVTAPRTVATTRSCVSRSIPTHMGSARFSRAARSVSGSEPSLPAEVAKRGLEVKRRLVVGGVADLGLGQRRRDPLALGGAHDVEVVDVRAVVGRQLDELAEPELGIPRGRLAALRVPAVEVLQEEPQRGRLKLVQPRVRADVAGSRACPASRGSGAGARAPRAPSSSARDEPAVADAAEVLRRIEAERRRHSRRRDAVVRRTPARRPRSAAARAPPAPRAAAGRPKRCTGMIARVRGVIAALDVGSVEIERRRVDVGEDRRCANARDRLSRRVEREGRADDLVTRPDLERPQHEHDAHRCRWRRRSSCGTPRYAAASSSNARTFGPRMNSPPSSTSPSRCFSSGRRRSVLRRGLKERNPRHAD